MPYFYAGHCEDCCKAIKENSKYPRKDDHAYEANFRYYDPQEMLEVKLSIIQHAIKTQHKSYLLMENYDNDRPFMMVDEYNYKPIKITRREQEDLEYIIGLQEQFRKRDYKKLEALAEQKRN
jgi:hypothetical protein